MIKALEEPTEPVRLEFQLLFGLANAGATLALLPVLNILIPAQVTPVEPAHSATNLAIVLTSGATGALIGNPLTGAFSDRTTSRFGRRSPWILIGAITTALGLITLANSNSVLMIAIGWFMVQFFGNMLLCAYSAILPDRVPIFQRGMTQSIVGFMSPVTMIIGVYFLGKLVDLRIGYYALAGTLIVLTGIFLPAFHEPALPKNVFPPFRLGSFLSSFWINPRAYPSFGIAWIFWFLVWSGYALGTGAFLFLYLQNIVHYAAIFPGHSPKEGIAAIQILQIAIGVPLMMLIGYISDKVHRRKMFVSAGAGLIMLGLILLGQFKNWQGVEIAGTILGIGFWIYYTIGLAMISQLLPAASNRGKDLGVINIAATLPQIIMPWIGASILNTFGSQSSAGYLVIFSIGALLTVSGIVTLQFIKNVC